jgi:hypothetical protein
MFIIQLVRFHLRIVKAKKPTIILGKELKRKWQSEEVAKYEELTG